MFDSSSGLYGAGGAVDSLCYHDHTFQGLNLETLLIGFVLRFGFVLILLCSVMLIDVIIYTTQNKLYQVIKQKFYTFKNDKINLSLT